MQKTPILKWWKGLSQNNRVALVVPFLVAVLATAGYLGKRWFEQPAPPAAATTNTALDGGIIQQIDGGPATVHTGTGDVVI